MNTPLPAAEDKVENSKPAQAIPASTKERVSGYDVARAVAILGMILVHFCLVMASDHLQSGWGHTLTEALDGRAAALFVVLAGLGVTLRTQKAGAVGDDAVDRILRRRGVCLLIAGYLNLLIWEGDILRVYGVILLMAPMFVRLSNRGLLVAAFAFAVGFIVLMTMMDYGKNWDWESMKYHNLWTASGVVRNLFYDGFRSVFPWTALFCTGMWLGRLDLSNRVTRRLLLWSSAGILVTALVISRVLTQYVTTHWPSVSMEDAGYLFGTASMPPLPVFLLTAIGFAGTAIALCLSLVERYPNSTLVRAWVATGRMAFTWYIAHIVIGLGGIVLLGLDTSQTPAVAVSVGCGFFAFALCTSYFWMKRFKHGPLEALLRRVAG